MWMADEFIVEMRHITKRFPGIVANNDISLGIRKGEIFALLGENGAGKSTLMSMLFGMYEPDEGEIWIRGKQEHISSPNYATRQGIGMVHQHFMLVPSLTVAENVVLGIEPKKGLKFDVKKAVELTEEIAAKYNLKVPAQEKVENITVGMKQRVELIKALLKGAELLILDEPTTVLTPQETEELFVELKHLKERGHTILFISHKLQEVKQLCDRVSIMRAGRMVATREVSEVTEADISKLMVGRDVVDVIEKPKATPGETMLTLNHVTHKNIFGRKLLDNVTLRLRKGEILGLAGVEGNGQHELLEAISGNLKLSEGRIQFKGKDITNSSVRSIRDLGLAHIPEDRMIEGTAKHMSITNNILAGRHRFPEFTGKVLFKMKRIRESADELIEKYLVKCSSQNQEIGMLSGGNIQKVVVAREFSSNPSVILIDQPTRGIDVGAAEFIRNKLVALRDEGKAILLNSADLNEVLGLSDGLAVFCNGKIVGYFEDASLLTEEELGLYMLGIKQQPAEEIERMFHE